LTMVDPTANLFINGNAMFGGGSTTGLLTAGTITLWSGSIAQVNGSGATDAFASSGTAVVFAGSDFQQHVSFTNPGPSHFQDFKSTNGLGTVFNGRVAVFGSFADSGTVLGDTIVVNGPADLSGYQAGAYSTTLKDLEVAGRLTSNDNFAVDWTHFTGPTALPAITFNGNVVINAPVIDTALVPALGIHNLYVAGPGAPGYAGASASASLTLTQGVLQAVDSAVNVQQGDLDPNGGHLLVSTGLTVGAGGTLTMTHASDSLEVLGNATFAGNSTAGLLTDGHVLIGRDLHQLGDPQSFAPSGSHVTEFTGPNQSTGVNHNINFANPGTSSFANLADNYPDTLTLQSTGATVVGGRLSAQSAPFTLPLTIRGPGGGTYYPLSFTEADVHGAVFDSVPAVFNVADSLIAFDSVTFNAPTDGFTQFAASGLAGTTITITNPIFTTIGSGTGYYVAATNRDSTGTFTVQAFQSNESQLEFDAHVLGDVLLTLIQWLLPS
ncbi:MAG: hypothetical protein ACREL4_07005, partial [Gemmatimonadales bacterium]